MAKRCIMVRGYERYDMVSGRFALHLAQVYEPVLPK